MNNKNHPILPLPQGSALTQKKIEEELVISGCSQGVPVELYPPEDLPTIAKVMGWTSKLTVRGHPKCTTQGHLKVYHPMG